MNKGTQKDLKNQVNMSQVLGGYFGDENFLSNLKGYPYIALSMGIARIHARHFGQPVFYQN
jgi:hypothetical protein